VTPLAEYYFSDESVSIQQIPQSTYSNLFFKFYFKEACECNFNIWQKFLKMTSRKILISRTLTLHGFEPHVTSVERQCCDTEQRQIEAASAVKLQEEKEKKEE
jgi:hypothetical protein